MKWTFINYGLFWFIGKKMLLMLHASLVVEYMSMIESANSRGVQDHGKYTVMPLSPDSSFEMYQHWMEQAYSGLFASIAQQKFKTAPKEIRKKLTKCSKIAKDVVAHANCLMDLLQSTKKANQKPKDQTPNIKTSQPLNRHSRRLQKYRKKKSHFEKYKMPTKPNNLEWVGNFGLTPEHQRIKRSADEMVEKVDVVKLESFPPILSPNQGLSPLGAVAKLIRKSITNGTNQSPTVPWQSTIKKLRYFIERKKEAKKKTNKNYDSSENFEGFAFKGIKASDLDNLEETMKNNPKKLDKILADENLNPEQKITKRLSNLIKDGVKLGYSLTGQNVSDLDTKKMKLMSPRFFSVLPDEEDNVNLLSPSILSLHGEGQGIENLTSIQTLMNPKVKDSNPFSKKTLFGANDQQEWMNLIIEAAGVNAQTATFEKEEKEEKKWTSAREKYDKEIKGKDGQPLYFTKKNVSEIYGDYETRKIETYEYLHSTFTEAQLKQMNKVGYSTLNKTQLKILYGPESPYNCSEALERLMPLTRVQIKQGMFKDIKTTAQMKSFNLRQKDRILRPVVNTPVILAYPSINQFYVLSPIILTPVILTPSVIGPYILSPFIFVPSVLSPRLMSPLILTPAIFSPWILSPLALHPFILSPGVFNPYILSPLILSPFILSPQVFSPLVLSPYALSPVLATPGVVTDPVCSVAGYLLVAVSVRRHIESVRVVAGN